MLKQSLVIATFLFLVSSPSFADDKPDWSLCSNDISKFKCSDAKGDENIYNCLIKHDGELSKSCDPETTKYEKLTGKPQ
jgi:hypothetical protein